METNLKHEIMPIRQRLSESDVIARMDALIDRLSTPEQRSEYLLYRLECETRRGQRQ